MLHFLQGDVLRAQPEAYHTPYFPFTRVGSPGDGDLGPQDPVLWLQYTNTHRLQKSWEEEGWHGHSLCERGLERAQEREPTPAWTGFYCFSGHITWRMVLIYYAQVHHR